MKSNASELYQRIQADPQHKQELFRQALQDPRGALEAICKIGETLGLSVTKEEIQAYLSEVDDEETKKWIIKARGGL
tara:strand:- start:4498 stop:4728 length:231 start_codon:yes stop_codon:yes gene_type:complete